MGTRFGGDAPYQAYVTRMRWLVGGLLCLVVVLVVSVSLLMNNGHNSNVAPSGLGIAMASTAPLPDIVRVLVAETRIESGTQLDHRMFDVREVKSASVPSDVLLENHRRSLHGKYASNMIPARSHVLKSDISNEPPGVPFEIPPGYRATTILIDARSGVEGYAKPDSRVDILWLYEDKNAIKKVATIVHFARVLSIAGQTDAQRNTTTGRTSARHATTTATLLVTERDAKLIELAQKTGTLSLSLIGEEEPGRLATAEDTISYSDLLRVVDSDAQNEEDEITGIITTTNPVTGKQLWFTLSKDGKWEPSGPQGGTAKVEDPKEQKQAWLSKYILPVYRNN